MTNSFGNIFRITTFGESHGHAMGVVVDGVPPDIAVSKEDIQKELDKRRPGQSDLVSARKELDQVEILSGIFESKTTGAPIAMIVRNENVRSEDYESIKDVLRSGHADYGYLAKYGVYDYRGGGRASARETVNWVAAGALAKKIINPMRITAYVKEIAGVVAEKIDFDEIQRNPVNCPDKKAAKQMIEKIEEAKKEGDSVGGVIEVVVEDVPAGLGDPVFDKLNANIAKALMTINGVKGVEIGSGFDVVKMKGSECNDEFVKKAGKIATKTNHAGGILGGISNGMPIIARIAVKPTSSISKKQETLTTKGEKTTIEVKGRHDPCIAIRAVPVAEAMMAIVLADAMLMNKK